MKQKPQPLSDAAKDARKPLPPEYLVGALQDTVHRDVGRSRAAKTVRNMKQFDKAREKPFGDKPPPEEQHGKFARLRLTK